MQQIHRISPISIIAASLISAAILTAANADQAPRKHPFIAANAPEIARIRAAFDSKSPEKALVDAYITQTDAFIDNPVAFPPRGGQHNQWYQCQTCELALKTIDETHHKCSKCGKIYTGHPYDDVIFSKKHSRNLTHALTAAWAYAISENPKYARYTAKILLGYADRYSKYPYHSASLETKSTWGARAGGHLYEQTLTEASALATQIAPAYDLIAETLTPAQQDHIQKGLLLPMLTSIDRNKAGKSNWQSWHNAAIIAAGALVNDPQWTEKALNDPKNGFHQQMKISVSDEGMWYENSWGYHFYTLKALLLTAEYARRLDIDIWSDPTLKKMFTLPVDYTMADGSLPRFGDDVNSSVKRVASLYESAYHAYKDPAIGALLSKSPSFQSILLGRDEKPSTQQPELQSKVFKSAGHAILRTNGKDGLTAAMTFGPYGGFHGHFDKLSFVFFAQAVEVAVDPGRAASQAYRLPIHTNWYKATISHNTVLVDRKSQQPAEGQLTLFAANDQCAAVGARCTQAYPGVDHHRVLVLMPEYLLVLDQLNAETEHTFDWVYHNRYGTPTPAMNMKPASFPKTFAGTEYIQDAYSGLTDNTVSMGLGTRGPTTTLYVAAADNTEVTVGTGPGASVTDRNPMTLITRKGPRALYAATLEFTTKLQSTRAHSVTVTSESNPLTVTVQCSGRSDTFTLTADNKLTVTRAGGLLLKTD